MPLATSKRKHSAAFKPQRPAEPNNISARKPGRMSTTSRRELSSEVEDDEEEAEEDTDEDDMDASEEGAERSDPLRSSSQSPAPSDTALKNLNSNPPPSIPPKLLTKILHHHLASDSATKDFKIDKDAMSTLGRYIETFTREAIARAAFERSEVNVEKEKRGQKVGAGEGFLEVEDLEKLAPQLLLDF